MTGLETALLWIVEILTGVIVLVLGGFMKSLYNKIQDLDTRLIKAVDEPKVRQILEDKLALLASQTSDIKEDIREMKQKLDEIYNQAQREKRTY